MNKWGNNGCEEKGWLGSKGATKRLIKQAVPPNKDAEYERVSNFSTRCQGIPHPILLRLMFLSPFSSTQT